MEEIMDFDYTQAYSALNAEDVKVGDIVFIGQTAADLHQKVADAVTRLACIVTAIQPKTLSNRFTVKTDTGFILDASFVYMLYSKGSEFYYFAKAIFEGKPVWLNVDGKITEQKSIVFDHPANCYTLTNPNVPRMKEKHNGLYVFNYKGFDCELADCSGTERYVCFVNYYDWDNDDQGTDLIYWSWGTNCDLGNNFTVPESFIKRLDDWIKKNPSKKSVMRYE
jgi:hypothetical protein